VRYAVTWMLHRQRFREQVDLVHRRPDYQYFGDRRFDQVRCNASGEIEVSKTASSSSRTRPSSGGVGSDRVEPPVNTTGTRPNACAHGALGACSQRVRDRRSGSNSDHLRYPLDHQLMGASVAICVTHGLVTLHAVRLTPRSGLTLYQVFAWLHRAVTCCWSRHIRWSQGR
jgi:hypothetical protein